MGIRPPQGILLYGPPGCAKTMCAKALATESGLNFLSVKGPELFSKYVGDTEKAVRELFRRGRLSAPCIIFLDEVDAMAAQRNEENSSSKVGERALTQLLTEMDGVSPKEKVIIIAATNRPWAIDSALLRAGRLDRLVYIGLPSIADRQEIFKVATEEIPLSQQVNLQTLAALTTDRTGAEITLICREAAMNALSEDIIGCTQVRRKHFEAAIAKVKPRVTGEMQQQYLNFGEKFQA